MECMDWGLAANVATTLGAFAGIVGGGFALWTFVRASRTRRAEWLASLHEQFFEKGRYVSVRRVLDYRSEPEYSELRMAIAQEQHHELADEFYRYLNFFEFLAGLRELRQISDQEILSLFEYDLRMLGDHKFVVDALKPQGFEHLLDLLSRLPMRLQS
jgi:hypothetical protein